MIFLLGLLELLLFELLELLQFIEEVEFPLLVRLQMIHANPIGLVSVLFLQVLTLNLTHDCQLLPRETSTPSFSLKELDSSSILWFMRVMTIFLLYLSEEAHT